MNRYYLQSMGGRRELDWRIIAPGEFEAERVEEVASGPPAALIFQRSKLDGARVPQDCVAELETEELTLYGKSP